MSETSLKGTIFSTSNNISRVACDDGHMRVCRIKGKRIGSVDGMYNALAVGDRVAIQPLDPGGGLIVALEPRKNSFWRYNEKGRAEQSIASNIDAVVCVTSPSLPPFRPRFVDRLAVLSAYADVPFAIVLNKIDLGMPDSVQERLNDYAALGFSVFKCSARKGEGLESLAEFLKGKTAVFAGQSGVGKSSLLNALMPGSDRKTGEVSVKYDRGRHTTTMAEMLQGEGWRIVDTPGIRRLAVRGLEPADLAMCFPEIRALSEHCPLGTRCAHADETGCAVRSAVESGEIHADRYESYLRMLGELSIPKQWAKSGNRDPGRRERARDPRAKARVARFGRDLSLEDEDL